MGNLDNSSRPPVGVAAWRYPNLPAVCVKTRRSASVQTSCSATTSADNSIAAVATMCCARSVLQGVNPSPNIQAFRVAILIR